MSTIFYGMKRFFSVLKYTWVVVMCITATFPIGATTLDEARELYKAGRFAEAAPTFKAHLKSRPNDGSLNHWYGVCLFHEKRYDEAEKYLLVGKKRKVLESSNFLAQLYMAQYRFDEAITAYEEYKAFLKKDNKPIPDALNTSIALAQKANRMLQYIERVQVIDTLVVDTDSLFSYYKMTSESGRIGTANELGVNIPDSVVGYMPQRGDRVFFGVKGEGNNFDLQSISRLNNGEWSEMSPLPEGINTSANELYPFFLNDGVTLYFASDGPGSIGGYDLFVSRQNLENGTFLKPENMGMPFNSLYNDYMLAIDEMLNVGWFVSDREQIPGKVTIYLFIPNESKQTYDLNTTQVDPVSLALIRTISDTWVEGADYNALLAQIQNIKEPEVVEQPDFLFAIANGTHYTKLDHFVNPEARNLYIKAIEEHKHIAQIEEQLAHLRARYSQASPSEQEQLREQIQALEVQLLSLYPLPEKYENQARQAEQKVLKKK